MVLLGVLAQTEVDQVVVLVWQGGEGLIVLVGGARGGGGGGGAGGAGVETGGNGGAGGRGEVIVWTVTGGAGADLAEVYYSLDMSLEAADVVVADPDLPGIGFKKRYKAYDGKVLGIMTTKPGLVLGDEEAPDLQGKVAKPVMLALAGRVPVKVSTENGPIEVGDYLTSSSVPGVAMRAIRPGPTVGKALEAYANPDPTAVGKVMAFVNVSWYDPDALRDNLSDISINLLDSTGSTALTTGSSLGSKLYTVSSTSFGNISRVGAFDQLALGTLSAGSISADSLNINHVTFQGQDLQKTLSSLDARLDSFRMSSASSSAQLSAGDVVSVSHQKTTLSDGSLTGNTSDEVALDLSEQTLPQNTGDVNSQNVEVTGIEPARTDSTDRAPHQSTPTLTSNIPYIQKSQKPYEKAILGVATSDKPPNNILLSGKTYVKVSTENGPILIGDYLTSSSVPGVAMSACAKATADKKGTCRPGPTVGKALESFDGSGSTSLTEYSLSDGPEGQSRSVAGGKIMAFVNVSYADPGNFLASLSLDDAGNLIMPSVKADKLVLNYQFNITPPTENSLL